MKNREIERFIGSWHLIPGTGGVFELTVNGDLLFSKKTLGRHAAAGELRALIEKKLAEIRQLEDGQGGVTLPLEPGEPTP